MKCAVCRTLLPIHPYYRAFDRDGSMVLHYQCVKCGAFAYVPATPSQISQINTIRLTASQPQQELRRFFRDGFGSAIATLQQLMDDYGVSFSVAYQILYRHWQRDLADWQQNRHGEAIPPPAVPVPVSSARSW